MVEHLVWDQGVVGSNPVIPTIFILFGALAQLGERLPCTQEVSGSIPLGSTISIFLEVYPSLAEGIGLENRQAGNTARGFESLYLLHFGSVAQLVEH